MNSFLNNVNTKNALTENNALTNSSAGDELVNQFGKASIYRNRPLDEVFNDQAKLHGYDPELAIKFVFYLRMITRTVKKDNHSTTEKVQRGQGNRDESFKRFVWYAINHPQTFSNLLYLFPIIGSWKDLFHIAFILSKSGYGFDSIFFFNLINSGLKNDSQRDLVLKYLPRIRSNKNCKTEWATFTNNFAKYFAKYNRLDIKGYRKLKSEGKAHIFQKLISNKDFDSLNFNTIPGKALLNLINGKFFKKHKLTDKLLSWVKSKNTVNFNGYPYELGEKVKSNLSLYQKLVIDKQFDNLLKTSKTDVKTGILSERNVICAIDRSCSMCQSCNGDFFRKYGTSPMNIAETLGIFFSSLVENDFKNWVIKFSKESEWVELKGMGFCDKKLSMRWSDCPRNTDAISIIRSICNKRLQYPNIPLKDFPNTLLIISDMEFDDCGNQTTREAFERRLLEVFPPEWVKDFVLIWWDVTGHKNNYPATIQDGGNYLFSGFDGSIITTLLGGISRVDKDNIDKDKPSILEIIKDVLNQEILQLVKLSVERDF